MDCSSQKTQNKKRAGSANKERLGDASVPIPIVVDVAEVETTSNNKKQHALNNLHIKEDIKDELLTPRRRSVRLTQKLNKIQNIEDNSTGAKVINKPRAAG